jgi:hypothetical protein
MIGLFGHLEDLICKALQTVTVSGLVLPLEVEDIDPIPEPIKLSRPGPVLLVAVWPLYVVYRVVRLPLLVVTL